MSHDAVDPNASSAASTGVSDSTTGSVVRDRAEEVHTSASRLDSVCAHLKQELVRQHSTGGCGGISTDITAGVAALTAFESYAAQTPEAPGQAGSTVAATSKQHQPRQVFEVELLLRHLLADFHATATS